MDERQEEEEEEEGGHQPLPHNGVGDGGMEKSFGDAGCGLFLARSDDHAQECVEAFPY